MQTTRGSRGHDRAGARSSLRRALGCARRRSSQLHQRLSGRQTKPSRLPSSSGWWTQSSTSMLQIQRTRIGMRSQRTVRGPQALFARNVIVSRVRSATAKPLDRDRRPLDSGDQAKIPGIHVLPGQQTKRLPPKTGCSLRLPRSSDQHWSREEWLSEPENRQSIRRLAVSRVIVNCQPNSGTD